MNLEERVYSVLVASAAENFNSALAAMLPESEIGRASCRERV